jgi:hypothetical protein
MVREPGNFHYVQTNEGEFILTEYWWREVKVGDRRYAGPTSGPAPSPGGTDYPSKGMRRKVFVEIVSGRGYEFFSRERLKLPISFTLYEDLPRNIQVRYGNSRGTLVEVFDGYHVDIGLDRAAKVVPGYNGVVQDLGDGQGLEKVAVVVYWEEDPRGEPLLYREAADSESVAPDVDQWGLSLKAKVLSNPKAPSAAPEASKP